MKKHNVIKTVEEDSIAEELGIEEGDILLDINGNEINDIIDYRYLIQNEYLTIGIRKPDGEEWEFEVEKDEFEDLGIVFESGLINEAKHCSNKCIFCFIDQLPKGMRDTLYFKDDDSRLSFLYGNYITLTNMKDEEVDKIIHYHLTPINISVHTTDMQLRKFMLKNPNAVNLMERIKKFVDAGIHLNFQIVLCKGINDGEALDKSIKDLSDFMPNGQSLSVVPIGLTKFREKLFRHELFTKEDCIKIVGQIENWQKKLKEKYGRRFVFASDEFYLKAELPLPNADYYEGFPQIENGVGMIRSMWDEFDEEFEEIEADTKERHFSVVTGVAAGEFIKSLCRRIEEKFINTRIDVYVVKNDFFGENITVAGLLTGKDIIGTLKGKDLGERLYIPESVLKADEEVLLDDVTIEDMERELGVEIRVSITDGRLFIRQFIMEEDDDGKADSSDSWPTECWQEYAVQQDSGRENINSGRHTGRYEGQDIC